MFKNRRQAGKLLAQKIKKEVNFKKANKERLIVLAVPRGGVIIGQKISQHLLCPLDVVVVKKIGAPYNRELAIGAIGETEGSFYLNQKLVAELGVETSYLEKIKKLKYKEIKQQEAKYRQDRKALALKGKIVIIADDGAATGATVIAATREVWNNEPKKVIIALPVVAKDTLKKLEKEADKVIFLEAPEIFYSVGQFYEEFEQVSDEAVIKILSKE